MPEVQLTWTLSPTNTSKVDGQRVYRSSTSSPSFPSDYTQIASVGDSVTSYTDTGLSQGDYTYAVTAFNSAGESSPTTTPKTSISTWTILIDGQKATGLLDAEDITILVDGNPTPPWYASNTTSRSTRLTTVWRLRIMRRGPRK